MSRLVDFAPVALMAAGWLSIVAMLGRMGATGDLAVLGPGMGPVSRMFVPDDTVSGLLRSLCRAEDPSSGWMAWATGCAMWIVMMVTMMLPCAMLPWRAALSRGGLTPALDFMTGYVLTWTCFAICLACADAALQSLVGNHLVSGNGLAGCLAIGVVAIASAYQFTPMKIAALHAMRCDPGSTGTAVGTSRGSTMRPGFAYGWTCLKANAPLMATMLVLGPMNIVAMLALSAVMTTEAAASGPGAARASGVALTGMCLLAYAILQP